ncbi:hypothetical protein FRC01_012761 [Tulasnella sp. 417]|nr:hypothetical protein FRC01_012761 [Tulasnella sp. 417]
MFDFTFRVPFQFRNPFNTSSNLDQAAPPRLSRPGLNTRPRPIPRPEMLSRVAEIDAPLSQKRRRGWQPTDSSGGVAEPQLSRNVSRGELERLGSSGCIGLADDDQATRDYTHCARYCEALRPSIPHNFPPTKRRRTTLTDTLLTSALNIALISGAVGLTAYRLWRGEPNGVEGDESGGYEDEAWHLIAEGQKALGKEIVVSSDDVVGEDEGLVDDGDEYWLDDEPYDSRGRQSGSRHLRTLSASGRVSPMKVRQLSPRKPANLATPDSSYLSRTSSLSRSSARQSLTLNRTSNSDFSPLQPSFNLSSSVPSQSSFPGMYQSAQVQPALGQASISQNDSPDLVSAMQRVRKAYGLGA